MNTEPHRDDPLARAQPVPRSPRSVESAGSPADRLRKIDTSALLGIQDVAAAMAEVIPKIDTSTLLGIQDVAAAFAGIYGDLGRVVLPDFVDATRRLFADLGLDGDAVSEDLSFSYAADDRAYEALSEAAPDVAAAVDRAASSARTAFWSRNAVRNSLSWLLVGLVLTLFVGGTFIPTWGPLVINTLSGSFAALEVRRRTGGRDA